jgi:hypothetical protein
MHTMKLEKVLKVCLKLKEKGFNFHTTLQGGKPKSKHNHYGYGKIRLNYVLHHPNAPYLAVFREQENGEYITEIL